MNRFDKFNEQLNLDIAIWKCKHCHVKYFFKTRFDKLPSCPNCNKQIELNNITKV
jgi:transcription initiation factor IIE alpha subunit